MIVEALCWAFHGLYREERWDGAILARDGRTFGAYRIWCSHCGAWRGGALDPADETMSPGPS